jgi:hypothetical protein
MRIHLREMNVRKGLRLAVLLVLCFTSAGASPRKAVHGPTLAQYGIPTYPGIRFRGMSEGNNRHYSFHGTLPLEKVNEVFSYYNKRLTASGWERDDDYGHGGERRRKRQGELAYAFYQKSDPDLIMSFHITEERLRRQKTRAKTARIHLILSKID